MEPRLLERMREQPSQAQRQHQGCHTDHDQQVAGRVRGRIARVINFLRQPQLFRLQIVHDLVEAGERLGFLPGDIGQKVDPYLRPMYDALYDMMGFDRVARAIERQTARPRPWRGALELCADGVR